MILKSERKVAQENILCYKFGDRNFFGTKLEMINRNYVYEKRKEQDLKFAAAAKIRRKEQYLELKKEFESK